MIGDKDKEEYILDLLSNKRVVKVAESKFYKDFGEESKGILDKLVSEGKITRLEYGLCDYYEECGQLIDLSEVSEGYYECVYGHETNVANYMDKAVYYKIKKGGKEYE